MESKTRTFTWRQARPPWLLTRLAHALMAFTEPSAMPGIAEAPMSAMISTVMVVGVMPTSVACSFVVAHAADTEPLPVLPVLAAEVCWATAGLPCALAPP